jgi:hypothetical protein
LAFSNNLQYLAVSSDKGTIHVFNLKINVGSTANDKPMPAPESEIPHISPPLSFIKGKFPSYPFKFLDLECMCLEIVPLLVTVNGM